jgi:hypothetical protein
LPRSKTGRVATLRRLSKCRAALHLFGKESATMLTTTPQQPPLRPGDRVRYIHDRGHIEVVESCEFAAGALIPHWQVITTWDGSRRVADAAEFVLDEGAP